MTMYEAKLYNTKLGIWVPDHADEHHYYPDLATLIHYFERAKLDGDEISYITINGKICPTIKAPTENCIFVGIKKEDKPMNNNKFTIDNLNPAEYDVAMEAIRKHRNEQNAWDKFMAAYAECEATMGHDLMMEYLGDFYGLTEVPDEPEDEYDEDYEDEDENDELIDELTNDDSLYKIINDYLDKNNY